MDKQERKHHSYLGDAVYAEWDGYGLWLRTGDHRDEKCDDKIYLDPRVLERLNQFYQDSLDRA